MGFVRRDIIEQRERFLDYAEERGAYVVGASSVQGEAPKYLLVEDHAGLFHAGGAISPRILSEFENGTGNPTLATLEKIASPFGLKVTFLPPESWRMRAKGEASVDV